MSLTIALNPNQLTTYWKKDKELESITDNSRMYKPVALQKPKVSPNLKKRRTRPGMSKGAQKRIRRAINWLVYLSNQRTKRLPSRRVVSNFQVSFITLSLPSKQMHSHKEIKERCLNQFLTICRKRFNMKNYVWKAELQVNGNIHFHITTDVFIHYMKIRKIWNQCINVLGYVDRYASTFGKLSFEEYCYWRRQNGNPKKKSLRKAFNYGNKTNCSNPNCTDVHSVKNVKNLASYMAKYLTKDLCDKEQGGIIAESAKELKGRLWFCSRSLSRLKNATVKVDDYTTLITKYLRELNNVFTFRNDFIESFFFNFKKLHINFRNWLREELVSHAIERNYPFPEGFPQFN